MTTNRAKGTARETLCFKQLKEHFQKNSDYQFIAEWKVKQAKVRRGPIWVNLGEDLWGAFDIALVYSYGTILVPFYVQVKSQYSPKLLTSMREKWKDMLGHCYLAVYRPTEYILDKNQSKLNIITKDFLLIRL